MSRHVAVIRLALNDADWGLARLEAMRERMTTREWLDREVRAQLADYFVGLASIPRHRSRQDRERPAR